MANDAPVGTTPTHCRLIWTLNPATSATISWSTAEPGKSHSVDFHIKGTDEQPATVLAESGRFTGGELKLHYHHARLTNLRWLLAQYHRPAFPAVKSPGTSLQSWVPLFEKHNVDLVCESDGHTIKRTVPVRGNVKDNTGVVYVGEGGLGVPQRTPKTERWYLQSPGMADQGNHVFKITFTKEKLLCECVLEDRTVRDSFERPVRSKTQK